MFHAHKSWTRSARARRRLITGLVVGLLPACSATDTAAEFLYQSADPYRGGALWDKWWGVPEVKEEIEPGGSITIDEDEGIESSLVADNPLYLGNPANNDRTGSQTWRCKECHGWDYAGVDGAYGSGSHQTNFPGVLAARGRTVGELFDAIRIGDGVDGGPEGHSFGQVLSAHDIADLVKFVREGTVPMERLGEKDGGGDAEGGAILYAASCAECHGADGKMLNFKQGEYNSEYVFDIAHGNFAEFVHKVRFGQPDGEMPNGLVAGYLLQDVADIVAYTRTLAAEGLEEASAVRGGALWDEWWVINGATEPTATNPMYEDARYNTLGATKSGSSTWRCKECHGWDYKGVDGAYGSGSHATGIGGVFAAAELPPEQLVQIIGYGQLRDGTVSRAHSFATEDRMTEGDVRDVALFIREGLVDAADLISYETKRSKGSEVAGAALWESNCGFCHGDDGNNINFKHDDPFETEYVADLARDNPFELAHKVRFGQPGSADEAEELEEEFDLETGHMPNKFDAEYTEAEIADVVAYSQTLAGTVERGGLAWDTWWQVSNVAEPVEPGGSILLENGTELPSSLPATNPLYASNPEANDRVGSQTWRCKECHGWDYLGVDGAYASGSHASGFPGVFDARGKAAGELYASIADGDFDGDGNTDDGNHAFIGLLGDSVVRDLVLFIQSTIDYGRELVDPVTKQVLAYDEATMELRTRDASLPLGRVRFDTTCASCHGLDGTKINFKEGEGELEYVGGLARDNPWEALHKMVHGQPGSEPTMSNAAGLGLTTDDLADLLLYTQELP